MRKFIFVLIVCTITSLILGGCSNTPKPAPVLTIVAITTPTAEETALVWTPSPSPSPTLIPEQRTLTICMGAEPETLYLYGGASNQAINSILEAVYDGPIDNRSFDYQPIILEKLPSLADGDAVRQPVMVKAGDMVVDANGDLVELISGVQVFPSGCSRPDCAVEYAGPGEIQMDRLAVEYKLLPDLKWSDGASLTAQDSVYSFWLDAHPETPSLKFNVKRTASYEALDDLTIQWVGLPGYMDPTYFLNFWTPLPGHIWGEYDAAELAEAKVSTREPIGWGPYVIERWQPGEYIKLSRNPYYFRADEGLPRFSQLLFRFHSGDGVDFITSILNGECDIVSQLSPLDEQIEMLVDLHEEARLNAAFIPSKAWEHVDFGIMPVETYQGFSSTGAFQDVRLRRAVALCMDRQQVVDEVWFGQSTVLDTYVPAEHPLFNPNVAHYSFDVEAGSALLEEIGWVDEDADPGTPRHYQGNVDGIPQGMALEFNYWTTIAPQRQQVSQILADSLARCGIKVNIQLWDSGDFFATGADGPLFGRQFDIGQFAWSTGIEPPCDLYLSEAIPGDPEIVNEHGEPMFPYGWSDEISPGRAQAQRIFEEDRYPFGWGVWNETGYSNPVYDRACKAALATLPGQPEYEENHRQAQEIFAEDLPAIPLYMRLVVAATRPDMCGFSMDSTDNEIWNIEAFNYGHQCTSP